MEQGTIKMEKTIKLPRKSEVIGGFLFWNWTHASR